MSANIEESQKADTLTDLKRLEPDITLKPRQDSLNEVFGIINSTETSNKQQHLDKHDSAATLDKVTPPPYSNVLSQSDSQSNSLDDFQERDNTQSNQSFQKKWPRGPNIAKFNNNSNRTRACVNIISQPMPQTDHLRAADTDVSGVKNPQRDFFPQLNDDRFANNKENCFVIAACGT